MAGIQSLRSFEALRILADPRRLEILRLLMAAPATLTQLGRRLHRSPAWISHHVQALEGAGLVQLDEVRVVRRTTQKFYRAVAGALLIEKVVLPKTHQPIVVFSGSHDPALGAAADMLQKYMRFLPLYVGSLNGLADLRHGICNLSGIHLLDESGEYNRPFVRHFFADRDVWLVTLASRSQGLMLAQGNPHGIRRVRDLARRGIRIVNRNLGSGTRLWLDRELLRTGVLPRAVRGYDQVVSTHTEAALWVKSGKVDAALGLQAAAHGSGLDFVPLFEERYDLVIPQETEALLRPFLDHLQSASFRASARAMTGYSTAHSGQMIPI